MKNKNRIYGYCRDRNIEQAVTMCKCLDAEQIRKILFNNLKLESAIRQTQHRLQILTKKEILQRWRGNLDEPYKYFINDFAQKEHICLLNWMFIHFANQLKHGKIIHVDYQKDYRILIPDLFVVIFNEHVQDNSSLIVYGEYKPKQPYEAYFFEMDNSTLNAMDKIEKYNKLFESKPHDKYVMLTAPRFPKIIIATTSKKRLEEINFQIKYRNKHNLNFQAHLIWDIKEECLNAQKINFCDKFIYHDGGM